MSHSNDHHSCVVASSLLDNLPLTNPFVSDDNSPQLSIQVDDDHNDQMFLENIMSSAVDDVNSVKNIWIDKTSF